MSMTRNRFAAATRAGLGLLGASFILGGCVSSNPSPLVLRERVDVPSPNLVGPSQPLPATAVALGSYDRFGASVYAHYLATLPPEQRPAWLTLAGVDTAANDY